MGASPAPGPVAVEEARRRLLGPQKQLLERAAFAIRDAIDRESKAVCRLNECCGRPI